MDPAVAVALRIGRQPAVDESTGELRERRCAHLEAAGVQGERRVIRLDRECGLRDDVAGVDVVGHEMPGDAVLGLAVRDRPGCDVEACEARQRTVVEVDREGHEGECFGRDEVEECDGEQHIEIASSQNGCESARLVEMNGLVAGPGMPCDELYVSGDEQAHVEAGLHGDLEASLDQ